MSQSNFAFLSRNMLVSHGGGIGMDMKVGLDTQNLVQAQHPSRCLLIVWPFCGCNWWHRWWRMLPGLANDRSAAKKGKCEGKNLGTQATKGSFR